MNLQPFLFGQDWIEVRDGNDTARAIFDQHYSRYFYKDGRKPKIGYQDFLVGMMP
jgi:hypothetical protein